MDREQEVRRFTAEEIGKATINIPTEYKEEASQIERDALEKQGKTNEKKEKA